MTDTSITPTDVLDNLTKLVNTPTRTGENHYEPATPLHNEDLFDLYEQAVAECIVKEVDSPYEVASSYVTKTILQALDNVKMCFALSDADKREFVWRLFTNDALSHRDVRDIFVSLGIPHTDPDGHVTVFPDMVPLATELHMHTEMQS